MDEEQLKDDFFINVIIDMGYVSMDYWEIKNVDAQHDEITFKRTDEM